MSAIVFDIEADGLLNEATKIHCLCYHDLERGTNHVLTSYPDIIALLRNTDVLIGHNIIRYDIPLLEKLLGIQITATYVDTLSLSWYLEPERVIHGLEQWGEDFGIPKPYIADWSKQSLDDYIHRCTEDVKINLKLWKRFKKRLTLIYGDWEEAKKLISYLSFKMDCAREQERSGWKLDREHALQSVEKLTEAKQAKRSTLIAAMPQTPVYALRKRPMKPFKKDGSYSTSGARWFALLERNNLPLDYNEEIKEVVGYEEPNPGSVPQVKAWLYSLGWKPATFKITRDKETGDIKKTPQINLEHGGGLCPSVKRLSDVDPAINALDELGVIQHRLGLLNGFLRDSNDNDVLQAQISGFTNTLRFIHKTIVNLPKAGKAHAEGIRGSLIARDGYELCGSDMSSLEDRLKQHYIYPFDPDYVEEMNVEGYDPHLSLAVLANEITFDQMEQYKFDKKNKLKTELLNSVTPIRDIFKSGNYACQYGAGPPRLALTANIRLEKAKQVHEAYWKKNWAIKEVAAQQKTKTVAGQMWLLNPVSGLWYSLRYEKDIFSTLVQGTASYVFDKWVGKFRSKRSQMTAQFHDEVVLEIRLGNRKKAERLLRNAIKELNEELNLNRELGIDVQFGNRYSEIH